MASCKKHRRTGKKYSKEYDAHYCSLCNKWLDPKCAKILRCAMCESRPRRPITT
ncbi:MAG TPA: hypothetical protein VHA09_01405 [Nitrososphaera sp.]|nr:hypothetical protein [Nitrososphaera sp.]